MMESKPLLRFPRPLSREGKPKICVSNASLGDLTDLAWQAVQRLNTTSPTMFRQGVGVVRLVPTEDGPPVIQPMNVDRLRHACDEAAFWFKNGPKVKKTEEKPANEGKPAKPVEQKLIYHPTPPPIDVVRNMLAAPTPPLPILDNVVSTPVFAANGELQVTPGYNSSTRAYYHPFLREEIPPLPAKPTKAEALAARDLILDDMICDFPFEQKRYDEAYILAMLLQPFLRPMIHGFTPFFLIDKPQPGTGATLLAQMIIMIVTGGSTTAAGSLDITANDAENGKKLLPVLLQNPTVVFLDNIVEGLTSKRVTETITSHVYQDRILGQSAMATPPVRCLWIGTGNNPKMSPDMVRRTIRVRLNAHMARPETRTGFRHADLELWVSKNLSKLIHACLTIGQYWVSKGAPLGEIKKGGGFEHWSQVMGGIMSLIEIEDFLGNSKLMHDYLDDSDTDWMILIEAWWGKYGNQAVKTSQIHALWEKIESEIPLSGYSERGQQTQLGKMLMERKDKHFGPYRVVLGPIRQNMKHWALQEWRSEE